MFNLTAWMFERRLRRAERLYDELGLVCERLLWDRWPRNAPGADWPRTQHVEIVEIKPPRRKFLSRHTHVVIDGVQLPERPRDMNAAQGKLLLDRRDELDLLLKLLKAAQAEVQAHRAAERAADRTRSQERQRQAEQTERERVAAVRELSQRR